jgi:chromosome segregation ATPase
MFAVAILLVLVSCSSPHTAQLERDLADANSRTASLENELAVAQATVADLNASLENATATLEVAEGAVKETADDIRKLDKLYDLKLDELRAVEADLASCTRELALYKPKVTTASTGGYTSIAYDD